MLNWNQNAIGSLTNEICFKGIYGFIQAFNRKKCGKQVYSDFKKHS